MRKTFFIIVFLAVITVYAFGLYPVAIVEHTSISKREWKNTYTASLYFTDVQKKLEGVDPSTRSKEDQQKLIYDAQRDTLSFLIENIVVRQGGPGLIGDFDKKTTDEVNAATKDTGKLQNAARTLYGLDLKDFERIILFPQARRNLLMDSFEQRNVSFGDWLATTVASKKVRLFFVPFRWNGTVVE